MKFVDTVVATIPLNKGEGFIPKDLHKIGVSKIKKMLALEVDHNGLKALKVDYIKIVKKDLSSVNFDDQGNIIGSPILTVNLIGTNDFVDFKNADIGSCFSFKFYDSALWGEEKPFYFEENKERFSKFYDKIIHIKSDTRGKDNWKREYAQRYEVLTKGVSSLNLDDRDIVSFCDLDEIIDPKLILKYKEELPSDAPLLVCPHWFNVSWDCYLGAWDHYSIIFSYCGEIKKRMNRWKGMQCGWRWDHPKFPQPIKKQELSGWHVSWFMKPEDLIIKLESFAHNGEEWVDELLQNIDLVKGLQQRTIRLESDEACSMYEDASVDFVFIDGDHSEDAVRKDLAAWFSKVKPGGTFAGHDFYFPGVNKAVNEFFASRGMEDRVQGIGNSWMVRIR